MRRVGRKKSLAFLVLALPLVLVASLASAAQVKYMLWDSSQLPAYRQCAVDFATKNPGTTIKITQAGWDDYWTAISIGFISGVAPDVFTNHLNKYPQFASNDLLVDLSPYIARDQWDMRPYPQGLVDVWGRAGKQFGMPKDWDTVALMVNMQHAKKAGVTLADLRSMRWNPQDGGTFEHLLRKLTLDTQGRNALHPDFDKKNVAVYGYQNPGPGGMAGQTEWSAFAVSNGFSYQDRPWSLPLRYDDPRLAQSVAWLASLSDKGISASYQNTKSLGTGAMFAAGKVAMVPDGSWMIGYFATNAKFENTWVPMPIGPSGRRATMLNGLADSIWVGSKVKEDAWKWVKYLGSAECQRVVASYAVVFPALQSMAERVVDLHKKKGVDASAFLDMAREQTFLTPVADNGAQIDALIRNAVESVLLGKKQAEPALKEANDKVRKVFEPAAGKR